MKGGSRGSVQRRAKGDASLAPGSCFAPGMTAMTAPGRTYTQRVRILVAALLVTAVTVAVSGCGGGSGSTAYDLSPDATFCSGWPDQCEGGHPLIPGKPTRTYTTSDGFDCYVSQYTSRWPDTAGSAITNCYASDPNSPKGYCIYDGRRLPTTQNLPIPCQAANVAMGGQFGPYAI